MLLPLMLLAIVCTNQCCICAFQVVEVKKQYARMSDQNAVVMFLTLDDIQGCTFLLYSSPTLRHELTASIYTYPYYCQHKSSL